MNKKDLTKVYMLEKYENEKKAVLACPSFILDLEYKKAKETLFFVHQEDIIDEDEFRRLYVDLRDLYYRRKYSYVPQIGEDVVNEVKKSAKAEVFASLFTCVLKKFSRVMEHDIANLVYCLGYYRAAFEFGIISEDIYKKMCDELKEFFYQKENK